MSFSPATISMFLLHASHAESGAYELEGLPSPHDLWSLHHWTWELSITVPLAVIAVWYAIGQSRRRGATRLKWQHAAFWAGWISLIFALVSPLHQLGDVLFSAHMLQHEILILVAAPLIAAAQCSVTLLTVLPMASRKPIGTLISNIEHHPSIAWIATPLPAWLLHAAVLWGWHVPVLYQATVQSDLIHAIQHLSFFVTGLIFWSALYGAGRSTMSYGAATAYTFGTAVHCSALGALLTFSTVLWYPIYATRTQIWHLSALQDQQLGGLLMWVPSGVIFIVIGVALFAAWIRSSGQRLLHTTLAGASTEEPS